jgi:hypothetical protein
MTTPSPLQRRESGWRGLPPGEWFNAIIDRVNSILDGSYTGSFTDISTNGTLTRGVQNAIAAGSNSQANATAITKALVMVVTVSATTRAVKLPAAATGLTVQIQNTASTAVKVYPATGDKIGSAATNAVGAAIATLKGNIYTAKDATTWLVVVGA